MIDPRSWRFPHCLFLVYIESAYHPEHPAIMLRIDLASRTPVYEQLANGLRAELVAGVFKPGQRLPTVRALAIDLGVHHNTVAQAYRQLSTEGWIDLKRHRGACVKERGAASTVDVNPDWFTRLLRELLARALSMGLSRSDLSRELSSMARRLESGGL